ncbi:MAG: ImmA/IrrE family metallo-endopeptidase [Methanothrix sp.]|nr:MAG: ImmA/IrrE family metallo-endopeptidase [Methanothrix sp.]
MASSFGQRLKAARVMAGLSMDALVAKMGHQVSKQAISKYENGLMSPDSGIIIALSKALSVMPDYFFSKLEITLEAVNFRKKASLGKKEVDSLKARVKDEIERYIELESLLPQTEAGYSEFPIRVIASLEDIEAAALDLRELWELGKEGPVAFVVDLLEEHGIKIIELDAPDGFDGLSGKVEGTPFIVLNKASPSDRKRLTALHEFAHLCLSFHPALEASKMEKLCHTFGGAFLMPRDVLIKELGEKRSDISFFELRNLKLQYGISMQAIMYRAKQHGIISEYAHEAFSKAISARGWRKQEPGEYPIKENPQHFDQLLHHAISEELISMSKGAYLANKSLEEIRQERLLKDAPDHS